MEKQVLVSQDLLLILIAAAAWGQHSPEAAEAAMSLLGGRTKAFEKVLLLNNQLPLYGWEKQSEESWRQIFKPDSDSE